MRQIAIIGAGPRGLSALENLFIQLSENKKEEAVVVSIFETSETPGSGNIWNAEQLRTNWLNISERALKNLPGRAPITLGDHNIPEFPAYSNWLPEEEQNPDEQEPDKFPERSKLGTYLNERFTSIAVELQMAGYLKILRSQVINIEYKENIFSLEAEDDCFEFDEVLLSVGHQPTKISDQLKKWKEHEKSNSKLQVFEEAYPVEEFLTSEKINETSSIAIRGFGLA
ncbi:FAD/NAD(P)-binding protein [Gillisia marina]|uniref:FAD/NAD(P)-binding protein n=1 Tax=Gillisia marina TaxID=1167637 RepID=UPI0002D480A2|nr:FAD/NAD(P)-binding protein [Gillisia marina]